MGNRKEKKHLKFRKKLESIDLFFITLVEKNTVPNFMEKKKQYMQFLITNIAKSEACPEYLNATLPFLVTKKMYI